MHLSNNIYRKTATVKAFDQVIWIMRYNLDTIYVQTRKINVSDNRFKLTKQQTVFVQNHTKRHSYNLKFMYNFCFILQNKF